MGTYTPKLFFFKPSFGARGNIQKKLFDHCLDQVDARLGKEIWVGDPQFVWHAEPFERLKNAVSGLDTTPAVLRIPAETYLIPQSYSIPENITVVLERGAVFHLETGVSLTLNGGMAAGPYQIFAGEGTAVFGQPAEIFSQWWGQPAWSSPEGVVAAPVGSRYVKTAGTPPLYYIKNSGTGATGWQAIGAEGSGGGAALVFTELYDTPSSYAGQAGKVVRVDALGSTLEFGHPDHLHVNKTALDVINQNLASTDSPTFAGLTVEGNLAVNGVDLASHKTRHEAGGPDALNHQNLAGAGVHTHADLDAHLGAADNPHAVTAAQVGALADLDAAVKDTHIDWGPGPGQVSADDIPDGAVKIIPTATQEEGWDDHLGRTDNPHGVTRAQVGLDNVTNDAQLKRADNDWAGFTEELAPGSTDFLLVEKAITGAKRKVPVGNLPTGNGGEANTASNQGVGGVGLFQSKVGLDLQFKNINAGSNKISVTDDPANKEVYIDVAPQNIPHQSLAGAGVNSHAQLDEHLGSTANPHGVTQAQVGLGNVTNDAQLKRAAGDINSFTEKVTPAAADLILIEDSAASYAKKKVSIGNLTSGSGGSTTFTGLSDTPGSLVGQGLKVARVNAAETALEFTDRHFDLPVADNSCSPLVRISGTAGENLSQWDLVYLNAYGKYYRADAAASAATPALAVATGAVAADNVGSFMLLGLFRDDSKSWATGAPLYLDTTAGGLTQTAPSGENTVTQVIGVALTPAIAWINPHLNYAGWFF